MEGEVEYLEVEELEELECRDQYDEEKSEVSMH